MLPNILYIYTDGSSYQKPRKGGMGVRYILCDIEGEEKIDDLELVGNQHGTNNQMELNAVILALKKIEDYDYHCNFSKAEVRSDSRYVTENIKNAIYYWKSNGWKNKHGKPIENADLWKELVRLLPKLKFRVNFEWVKGHSNDVNNKAVDKLAKQSAKNLLNKPMYPTTLRRKKTKKYTKIGSIEPKGQRISLHIINDQYMKEVGCYKYRCEVISPKSPYFGNADVLYSEIPTLKPGHSYFVVLNKNPNNPTIKKLIRELKKK